MQLNEWFLSAAERGNSATTIDRRHPQPWTEGNTCGVLVHGADYFSRLFDELRTLEFGDDVSFTDWR
ncbi:MAG: phospholipase D/Transphosphatidylase, partial [Ilumatobacteraceae bacterium]|nr:phospholipase D/Transphosphatidylase [Ilumatobacteraceae bacterium]